MQQLLLDRPPWYVAGALMAAVVLGLLLAIDERIGVLGGFSAIVERVTGRTRAVGWKAWFLAGVAGGGLLYAALSGSWSGRDSYAWLTGTVGAAAAAPILVGAGVLIGFGAKTAGGCTSGNGLGGCSVGSTGSFVATGTFMATAVAATLVGRLIF